MYDIELVKEILHQILWSAQTIAKRMLTELEKSER